MARALALIGNFASLAILYLLLSAEFVAAGAIVLDHHKTQKDVAEAAGVTEVTIRNRYKGLKTHLRL